MAARSRASSPNRRILRQLFCDRHTPLARARRMSGEPPSKSARMEFQRLSMGTHSGAFQADEALGIWMLRQLPKWRDATLTRSRDPKVLEPLDIVIDVGGLYEHAKLRYDHHQRGFFETFDGALGPSGGGDVDRTATGPESATGAFKTKLSASGLVYKHYGCLLYTSPSPRDRTRSRMPSSA